MVFRGFRWVLRVIDGSRSVFIVPGWFFIVPGRFFMVPGRFVWFFKVPGWFFIFFLWFQSRSGFHDSLMVPGWFKSELSAGGGK